MKSLQDALYNWLSIKVVCDRRPDDQAAKDTFQLFDQILQNDHKVEKVYVKKDGMMYILEYEIGGERKTSQFPIELIDIMINQMEEEPEKFPNYHIE